MKQISVYNKKSGLLTNQARFKTLEECQNWLVDCESSESFGKPEHQKEIQPEIKDEAGEVIQEAVYETIPAEYTVEIEDVTSELEKLNKIRQIEELELQITPRRLREAVLSQDFSFIESIEQQIQAIRQTL